MTRYEKLSTLLSVFALIGAIASPFISYRWLDPQIQAFRNRAKLQISPVSTTPSLKLTEFKFDSKGKKSTQEDFEKALKLWADKLDETEYNIDILNIGDLPAKDTLITVKYGPTSTAPAAAIFDPPVPTETSLASDTNFITLKRPIAPKDKIAVKFARTPRAIWVSNEFGETTTLLPTAEFWISGRDKSRIYRFATHGIIN